MWKNWRKRNVSLICGDFVLRMKLHEKSKTKQDQLVPATLLRLPWGRNCHFFLCSWYQSSWSIVSKEAQSSLLARADGQSQTAPERMGALCHVTLSRGRAVPFSSTRRTVSPSRAVREPICGAQIPAKASSFQVTGGGEKTTTVG